MSNTLHYWLGDNYWTTLVVVVLLIYCLIVSWICYRVFTIQKHTIDAVTRHSAPRPRSYVGNPRLSVDGVFSMSQPQRFLDMLHAEEKARKKH